MTRQQPKETLNDFAYTPQTVAIGFLQELSTPFPNPIYNTDAGRFKNWPSNPDSSDLPLLSKQHEFWTFLDVTARGSEYTGKFDDAQLRGTLIRLAIQERTKRELELVDHELGVKELDHETKDMTLKAMDALQRFQDNILEKATPSSPDISRK